MIAFWQESYDKPRQCVEKWRHYSADKGPYSQGYGLPNDHVQLWELDCKEGRTPKNWCLQTVVLEKTPENSLDSKELKPVNLKGNQPWILIGRTDAEAGALVFRSSDMNSQLTGKPPDARKDWGQKKKRVSEDEMAGWHHQCNGHELGKTSGDGEGQGGLACCSPLGCKELDMPGRLNNSSIIIDYLHCNVLLVILSCRNSALPRFYMAVSLSSHFICFLTPSRRDSTNKITLTDFSWRLISNILQCPTVILFLCIIPTGWKVPVLRYCLQKTVSKDCLGTKLELEGKSGMEKGMCSLSQLWQWFHGCCYVQIYPIVYSNYVEFIVYQLYLNKDIF